MTCIRVQHIAGAIKNKTLLLRCTVAEYLRLTTLFLNNSVDSREYPATNK
jgi:hypothetical protein